MNCKPEISAGSNTRDYVATLEGEIRRALTAAASDDPKGMVKGAVTLKRFVVWTRDATMALRLMSIMVEEAKGGYYRHHNCKGIEY